MSISLRPGSEALELPKSVSHASEISSHWNAIGSALTQTQVVQNGSGAITSLEGATADAVKVEVGKLGEKISDLATVFPGPAKTLTEWEGKVNEAVQVVTGLQQRWDEAIANYNKAMGDIAARRATDDNFTGQVEEKNARAILDGAQRQLKKSYDDQLHQLNDAASQAADAIRAAADSKISPDAVKRGRNAVGAEFFGPEMPLVSGAERWAYAQAEVPRMAADFEEAANSNRPLNEEEVKALMGKWGDKLNDPFFVQALAEYWRSKHGGKGDYSDLLNRLAIKSARAGIVPEGEATTRNAFISRIGTAMVLSTGGVNADQDHLADSAVYEKVKNYLRGTDGRTTIAETEQANIESFKETGDRDYAFGAPSSRLKGFQIFTQATALAAVNNPDLAFGKGVYEGEATSLAAKIVDFDHTTTSYENVNNDGTNSIVQFTGMNPVASASAHDPLQSLYLLSDTPDSMQTPDFVSKYHELAGAEQGRLDALRGFLMQDTSFDVENDWDRNGEKSSEKIPMTRYLTGNRNHGLFPPRGFVDAGDAFGSMIEDATRPLGDAEKSILGDNWKGASNQQARIVGNFTAGYQDGLDHDGDKIGSQDAFGATNSKLRSHAGVILANWVESLAQMDTDDAGDTVKSAHDAVDEGSISATTGQAQFVLSPKLRDALYGKEGLFADLAFDNPMQVSGQNTPNNPFDDTFEGGRPPALSTIQAAAYAGYKHDLTQAMASEYRVDPTKTTESAEWSSAVNSGVKKWGGLFEHIESAVSDQEVAEHRAIADRNKLIRKGIDVVASTVPFSQVPGPKILESLVSAVTNDGKNAVLDSILPTDFNREEFLKRLGREYAATQAVSDTLASTYVDLDEWPNSHGTPKQELVAEFLRKEEEGHYSKPVKADEHGGLPPYNEMTDAQQGRLREFLKERTYLKTPLETAKDTTWAAFSKQEVYRH
jgi:hypothetical protein